LHGYDKPWVGGADINLLDLKSRFPDNAKSVTSDGVTYTRVDDADGNPIGVQASNTATGYSYCDVQLTLEAGRYKSAVTGIEANKMSLNFRKGTNREYFKAANEEFTLTEQTLIFVRYTVNQGDTANNTIKCMIYKYDGTDKTFRPYSNICPISGRTAVVVNVSGHNMWDEQWEVGGINSTTGQPETASDRIRSKNYIPISGNTDYFAKISGNNVALYIFYYDENYNHITSSSLSHTTFDYKSNQTTHSPANARYMKFNTNGAYGNAYHNNIGINYPNSLTDYVPYVSNKNYIIQLGQTVYGAEINWDTGVGTVDRIILTNFADAKIDEGGAGTSEWLNVRYDVFGLGVMNGNEGVKQPIIMAKQKNNYTGVWQFANANGTPHYYNSDTKINAFYPKSIFADLAAFKTYEASNRAQFVLPLATPTTIQLTPEQLEMLKGYNRVTIDNGSIELGYIAKLI
jgi:hypothetical protein